MEHRFYGLSNPGPDLSASSLVLHTLDQAVEDLVYFAENAGFILLKDHTVLTTLQVKLPMPNGGQVGPTKSPWILIGGSYSGALTAWTMQQSV